MDLPSREPAPPDPARPETVGPGLSVSPLARQAGVRAVGEVSLATRGVWERVLEQALSGGEDVYRLELSEVTFVDVAGAGALADAARRLGPGRRMVLHRPPSTLPRILEMFWPGLPGIEVSTS